MDKYLFRLLKYQDVYLEKDEECVGLDKGTLLICTDPRLNCWDDYIWFNAYPLIRYLKGSSVFAHKYYTNWMTTIASSYLQLVYPQKINVQLDAYSLVVENINGKRTYQVFDEQGNLREKPEPREKNNRGAGWTVAPVVFDPARPLQGGGNVDLNAFINELLRPPEPDHDRRGQGEPEPVDPGNREAGVPIAPIE